MDGGNNHKKDASSNSAASSSRACVSPSANFEDSTDFLTDAPIDKSLACTATTNRACHIVHYLSSLNDILIQADLEIREVPGQPAELLIASSVFPSSDDNEKPTQRRLIALMCILFQRHHCVKELSVNIHSQNSCNAAMCDALRENGHIKILKLHGYGRMSPISHPIFSVIPSFKNLKILECTTYGLCNEEILDALVILLHSSKTLESLHIPNVEVYMDTTTLLTALISYPLLKQLSLNYTVLEFASAECRDKFMEFLSNTSTLETLGFAGECHFGAPTCSKVILRGLCDNKSILEFEMEEMIADGDVTNLVEIILAQNTVLRRFRIASGSGALFLLDGADCNGWLQPLISNETLEELALTFDIWWPHQWRELFAALSQKHSLKKLTIGGLDGGDAFFQRLCEAVREFGVEEKVNFGPRFDVSGFRNFSALRCKSFEDICASSRASSDALLLHALVREISTLTHVTSLSLGITPHTSNKELSSLIANYIGTTTSLKKLYLHFYSDAEPADDKNICWTTVIKALSTNRSVSKLGFDTKFVKKEDIEYLGKVIRGSENISRVSVRVPRGQLLDIFLLNLSTGIGCNYALVSAEFHQRMGRRAFAVCDTARRNSGFVARASHFYKGAALEWITAGALERVFWHPALFEEFAEAESMSLPEAEAALKGVVKRFEDMDAFMRLAGVVRGRVVCHVREDGCLQLDDLNTDCWRALRRYLFLDYVVVPMPHAWSTQ